MQWLQIKWVLVTVAVVLIAYLLLRRFEWRQVYYPSRSMENTPLDAGMEFEEITFVTQDDCELHGWWIPAEGAAGSLIFCHGNGGNLSGRIHFLHALHGLGLNVFAFDYRGYGKSRGYPSEKGTYLDALAAYEVVRNKHGDKEEPPVLVFGRSLGGAVAAELVLRRKAKAIVLESTFTSIGDMAERQFPGIPLRHFLSIKYDTLSKMPRIKIPTLIAHGKNDSLVPVEMGRQLAELAGGAVTYIETDTGHNDVHWETNPAYWEQLKQFVARTMESE